MAAPASSPEGIVVIDKPPGWTSHDVVGKVRRVVNARKVGHAGTLDPMATGVLVVGILRATRLLGFLSGSEKEYLATMRLGVTTTTDDAEGQVLTESDTRGVSDEALLAAIAALTGDIQQVPSSVSAIKVAGVRSYKRARAGETVDLPPRPVSVTTFDVLARRGSDVDVRVVCSAGTYVRALARDLGTTLGVGAHLTALRRTRAGQFTIEQAQPIGKDTTELDRISLAEAVALCFPRIDVDDQTAQQLRYGQRVRLDGVASVSGAFAPDGGVVALVEPRADGSVRSLVGFAAAED